MRLCIRTNLLLIAFVLTALLASACGRVTPAATPGPGPATPTPAFILDTAADLRQAVAAVAKADEASAQAQAGAFWQYLEAEKGIPAVFGEQVFFFYKGDADQVAWRGDFTSWELGAALAGERIGKTNLWWAETKLPIDSRANYKLVLNGKDWILDPANPLIQPGGLGDNSILVMPQFQITTATAPRPETPAGTVSADIAIASKHLGYVVNYRVYTPAGYDEMANLPAIYVTDGNDWVYEPFGAMAIALDNLIAHGRIQPVLAVFVDAREPANPANNRREAEFLDHPEQYARFLAQELAPAIDSAYRTEAKAEARLIQGASYGGLAASFIASRFPEVFGGVAAFSPSYWVLDNPGRFAPTRSQSIRQMDQIITDAGRCGADTGIPCPPTAVKVFISAGIPAWDVGDLSGVATGLQRIGMPVRFIQVQEGHNWGHWSGLLDEMLVYFFPPAPGASATIAPTADAKPFIIDTDMAPDDWMAILYLLQQPKVDVRAITVTGAGEAHCEAGVSYALALAALAGRPEIPVTCGRATPLQGNHVFPDAWRQRADTLAGLSLPANPSPSAPQDAVGLLRETLIASPQPVTVVTLGPLTNIAEALQSAPELRQRIQMIFVMGGAFHVPGNVGLSRVGIDNTGAEWNLYIDPHAAAIVLESGAPLTFVPLDATNRAPVTMAFYDRLEQNRTTPVAEFVYQVLTTQAPLIQNGLYWFWDPLTAVVSVEGGLAEVRPQRVHVIEREGAEYGATRISDDGAPAEVVWSVDASRFEDEFLAALNRPGQ